MDVAQLEVKLEQNGSLIERVKILRDEHLAHEDVTKQYQVFPTIEECERLVKLAEEILNATSLIFGTETAYEIIGNECERDMEAIVLKLQ